MQFLWLFYCCYLIPQNSSFLILLQSTLVFPPSNSSRKSQLVKIILCSSSRYNACFSSVHGASSPHNSLHGSSTCLSNVSYKSQKIACFIFKVLSFFIFCSLHFFLFMQLLHSHCSGRSFHSPVGWWLSPLDLWMPFQDWDQPEEKGQALVMSSGTKDFTSFQYSIKHFILKFPQSIFNVKKKCFPRVITLKF